MKLTSIKRRDLRAKAHTLNPIVMIGEAGLTAPVIREIDQALSAHTLIKIRIFSDDREQRATFLQTICSELNAESVQQIGKLLVIFRPQKELHSEPAKKRGKRLRKVVIVVPSASGTRKPTVSKIMLKGNERITQGGKIKRAKIRQTSSKKV